MNATNVEFYRNIKVERFMEFAELIGLGTSVDVDVIYHLVRDARIVYELGAGYGRVVQSLVRKGFEGRVVALERSPELVNYLRRNLPTEVVVRQDDYMQFEVTELPDVFLWMWSGVLELSRTEQERAIVSLAKKLPLGGRLIAEIPLEIRFVGRDMRNRKIKVQTEWGSFDGYLPSHEELLHHARRAGFRQVEQLEYETASGLRRCFYVMHK
jgi:SAM-dependent methyltransferase